MSTQRDNELTRREALRRGGFAASSVALLGGAGSRVAPQYSPVGQATAHPAVAIGAGMAGGLGLVAGSHYLLGQGDEAPDRGAAEYDAIDRLSTWADAVSTTLRVSSTERALATTVHDFATFSEAHLFNEAGLEAASVVDDGGSLEEAVDAAESRVEDILVGMELNVIEESHVHYTGFLNLVYDALMVEDLDPCELIEWWDPQEYINEFDDINPDDSGWLGDCTVEYELLDGSTLTRETQHIRMSNPIVEGVLCPAVGSPGDGQAGANVVDVDLDFDDDDDVLTGELLYDEGETFHDDAPHIVVSEWPEDEYDDLDEETRDEINRPGDEFLGERPPVLFPQMWIDSLEAIYDVADDVLSEVEQFIEGIYDDLGDGDEDLTEYMTSGMLAHSAAENQTFPFASSAMAGLGVPMSEQTVKLEFPETIDEETGEPAVSTGNLFAHPMPSGGFSVGETYDPDELDTTIWYTYHVVDDDGFQSSQTTEITEPFTVLEGQVIDEETGEAVPVDEVDWDNQTTTEAPTDYDELLAALEEVADLQRELEDQEREIVVELDGEQNDDDLGLPGLPGSFDEFESNDWFGFGIIALVALSVIGAVTSIVPFLGD